MERDFLSEKQQRGNTHEVNMMKNKYETLQQEIQTLIRKNNDLEQYTIKENLRLLFVPEDDDENCEEVVVRCLTEMGINPASMDYHAVLRVEKKKPSPTNSTEEINVKFISRKDRIMYGRTGEQIRIPLRSCSRMHFLYPISPKRKRDQRYVSMFIYSFMMFQN